LIHPNVGIELEQAQIPSP